MRVQGLAKKMLIMYNVSCIAFQGHMQTCALKDTELEESGRLGLGKLKAIDETNRLQMINDRKSVAFRRKTMRMQGGDSILNLETQMNILVRKHLPKNI